MFIYLKYTGQIDTGCFAATIATIFRINPYTFYLVSFGVQLFSSQLISLMGFGIVYIVTIREAFEDFNNRINATIIHFQSGQARDFTIWPLVAQHRKITKMVKLFSETFGLYALVVACFTILQGCFELYLLFFVCPNTLTLIITSGCFITLLSLAIIINSTTVQIHKSVSFLVYNYEWLDLVWNRNCCQTEA